MEKIDVQNFKKYLHNDTSNATLARVGHVNAVIEELNNLTPEIAITAGPNIAVTGEGTPEDPFVITGSAGGGLAGTSYVLVKGEGTAAENGVELQAAYTAAQSATPYGNPLSTTNRFTILVAPGDYYSTSTYGQFVINTNYVDIVSLSGLLDVYLSGTSVGATDVYLKGLSTRKATDIGGTTTAFNLAAYGVNQTFDTCGGGANSFGWGGTSTGKFINCIAGDDSFCAVPSSSSPPNIVNLGDAANAAGTYIDCIAGDRSFGAALFSAIASGTFTNCTSQNYSFGTAAMSGGIASGIFINCKGTGNVFGGADGIASGNFTDCTATDNSFGGGYNGNASGIFNNCISPYLSFGGYNSANGTFNSCIGGLYSFGNYGVSTGTFNNCIAGEGCFDAVGGPLITRKLYYCRLTSGEFKLVTGTGLTRYCLDGNNVANNQG